MSQSNSVGWFEIYVDDMERAKRFYQGVFQVELEPLGEGGLPMWAFPAHMDRYGAGGALVHVEQVPAGQNSVVIYFSCEDCAVEAARVEENGGTLQKEKFSIGEYGFVALALDSEGNMIGLHSGG